MRKFLLLTIILVSIFSDGSLFAATWYSKTAQTVPTTLTNWTANNDGTGANPANFTTSGDLFIIQAGHSYTSTAAWTLAAGVNLQINGSLDAAGLNLSIGGTTSITSGGTFLDGNNLGGNTFTGLVTIASGGTFNPTSTSAFVFSGGISNSGTFNKTGAGANTFNATQSITANAAFTAFAGNSTVTSGTVTIDGTKNITFSGTFTVNASQGLTITNTGTNSFNSTFTNNGTFNSSAIVAAANLVFGGSVTNSATGVFTCPTATLAGASPTITATTAINFSGGISLTGSSGNFTFTGAGGTSIAGSGAYAFPGNLTASGLLTFTNTNNISIAGTLGASSGALTFSNTGNLTVTGATTVSGTGSIIDNNNSGITTFNTTYTNTAGTTDFSALSTANLVFKGSVTFTAGTFNVSTATLAGASLTITATTAINFSGGISLTGSSGNFTFTGAGGTSIAGSGAYAFPGNLTASGPLTFTNTNDISIAGTLGASSGALTFSNTGNLTVTGATTVSGTGSIIDNNNSGITTFNTTYTNTAGTTDFSALSTANLVFKGSITFTAGTFNVSTATLAGASLTITATTAINFSGGISLTGSSGNFTFTGAGGTSIAGSGAYAFPGNLTASGPLTFTNTNDISIAGTLGASSGALTFSNTGNLTVTGATTVSGTGSIIDNNNSGITTFNTTYTNTAGTTDFSALSTANLVFKGSVTFTAGTFNVPTATLAGASLTITATTAINFSGGISLTGSSGNFTFTGAGGTTLGGTTSPTFPAALTVSGPLTLNTTGTTTVTTTTTLTSTLNINGKVFVALGNIALNAGGVLDIGANGFLKMANGTSVTNTSNGIFKAVGTSGNPATVTNNGAGNYIITQNGATATFHANYAVIEYTSTNGVTLSNGSLDATNNFSNTTFQNGIGTAYLTLTGLNLGGGTTASGTVFETGPTYNVTRTSGTGAITFANAGGGLASGTLGEANDNDNGNPGTLINWSVSGNGYYSQGTGNFSDLSNWNTLPGGGGSTPTAAKLTDGSSTFIVQNADVVTIDQNLDVLNLQTTGLSQLIFGNNGTARTVIVEGDVSVGAGTIWTSGSTDATHILTLKGNFVSDGTTDFMPTASRLVNLNLDGNTKTLSGTSTPAFANVTFNSAGYTSVSYTAAVALNIKGTVTINANGVFNDGGLTHSVGGNWFQTNLATSFVSTGTIQFNGTAVQSIGGGIAPYNVGITFNNLTINGGQVATFNQPCTINGNFLVNSNSTVAAGTTTQTFNGDFSVTSGSTLTSGGTFTFNGAAVQSIDISNCGFTNVTFSNTGVKTIIGTNTTAITGTINLTPGATIDGAAVILATSMRIDGTCNLSGSITFTGGGTVYTNSASNTASLGTADVICTGSIWTGFNAPATSMALSIGGNLTVNASYLVVVNNTTITGAAGKTLAVNPAAILYCRGTNNFPTGFATYTLDVTSFVTYDGIATQTIRGNLTYGNIRFNIAGGTKTVDGPLDVNGYMQFQAQTTLELAGYNHTVAGTIYNGQNASIINTPGTGSFTLDADDANQNIETAGTGGYTFNNFSILQNTPTAARTKIIYSTLNITGNFSATNPGGDAANTLIVNLVANALNGVGGANAFTLGSNTILQTQATTGVSSFGTTTMSTFEGAKTLDVLSTVSYTLNGDQDIATGFTYGNILFSGGGNKTTAASLDINGNIIANAGIFVDGGFAHTVAGDWLVPNANYTAPTSTITLDGSNQNISTNAYGATRFYNLVCAGSSTKTQNVTVTVLNDLTVNNGATLSSSIKDIYISGNWSQGATGLFTQTTGTTYFVGSTVNQTVVTNASSSFGNVIVNKPTVNRTVTINSTCNIAGYLDVYAPNIPALVGIDGALDFSNQKLYVGDNFYFRAGSGLTSVGSTLYLNGANGQNIIMNCIACSLNNLELQNAGLKTVTQATGNVVDINGYVNIVGATFNGGQGNGIDLTVAGDWTNTGVFQHNGRTVTFDGGAQNIGQSGFGSIVFAGTDTKLLAGAITLNNNLTISDNVTLDVSLSNYPITLSGDWSNYAPGSVFVPRQGTVNFTGGSTQNVYSGSVTAPAAGFTAIGAGKSFYNVVINKTTGTIVRLGDGAYVNHGDMDILRNLNIQSGTLGTYGYDVTLAGHFTCTDVFSQTNANSVLVLQAASGAKNFAPGTGANVFRDIYVNATGATYTVQDNFNITNANSGTTGLIINGGTFNLNGKSLSFVTNGNVNVLTVNTGGTFNVGAGGYVYFANDNDVNNNGGTFMLVGTSSLPATLSHYSTGGYCVTQTSGMFHAMYYRVEFLNNSTAISQTGLTIAGGTIDATNNFSEGIFTNGFTNSGYYLDLSGYTSDIIAPNVIFNNGPVKNVKFSSGTGSIFFVNSTGTLTGASYEIDDGSATTGRVRWKTGALRWTGLAGDGSWNTAGNWASNTVPTLSDTVILDHSTVAAAYTVNLNVGADGICARLVLDKAASPNAIGLTLAGTNKLTVADNVNILAGCDITTTTSANTISVAGNWANTGTYTCGSGTIIFNPTSGVKTITPGASAFNNLTINGSAGSTVTMGATITVNNDIAITNGTFDVTTGNFTIDLKGNWNLGGSGVFTCRQGTLTLSKTGPSTQTVNTGTFYNVVTSAAAPTGTKQFTGNLTIGNDLTIGTNTVIDAGTTTLYVNRHFTNNASASAFSQTGAGTIIFGGVNQNIDNGTSATAFNFVTAQGTGTKTWYNASSINGDFLIAATVGAVDLRTHILDGTASANTFTVAGATNVYLKGASNFPTNFETLSIASNSTFYYQADLDQDIYAVPAPGYGNLTVQRASAGSWTKKALGHLIVTGNLNIGSGTDNTTTLDMATNNANIILTGNLSLPTGAPQISWGTTSLLDHVGAGWNIDADITTFNNLALDGTGTKTMYANLTITGDVSINGGVSLTMQAFTMNCTAPAKTFTMSGGSILNSAIPQATGVAFPTGFNTYTLNATSSTYLNASVHQLCKTTNITYGNLRFADNNVGARNVTLETGGNLVVAGNFYQTQIAIPTTSYTSTLLDNGNNITVGGADVWFGPYTPSSAARVQTFNGNVVQIIRDYYENATLDLGIVVFSGSGAKTYGDGGDAIVQTGSMTINAGATVNCSRNLTFSGSTWTNSGTWSHTANAVTFTNAGAVAINVGATNAFYNVDFQGGGTFTFSSNGGDFNGPTFSVTSGTVNMGALTHTIYAGTFTITGTWNTSNANLTFDGTAQTIPGLTAKNIICANSNTKTLAGAWNINDLTINTSVGLNTSASNYNITTTGNWNNSGAFTPNTSTVLFNGATSPININNNTSNFYIANFNPTAPVTYNLLATTTTIRLSSDIGSNAYLNVNGQTLVYGSNQPAGKIVNVNGTLDINTNATVKFDNTTSIVTMNVAGTLKVVGTPALVATITGLGGSRGHQITVTGNIQARYYLIEYLSDNGMDVQASATLDATNNFSDGTWSNMRTGGAGARRYLILNCPSPGTDIANTLFNLSGAATVGTHYNVQRNAGATGVFNFVPALGGTLGDYQYEDDGSPVSATLGKLTWPGVTQVTWTGAVNTNWHLAGNWSPATVPTTSITANIPLVTNNPIISAGDAFCKNLNITNGQVSLQGGRNLTTGGDIIVGTGSSVGVLTVSSSASLITCAGSWTRGSNGVFTHGSSSIVFTGATGASTITPLASPFYNVTFDNPISVFYWVGTTTNVAGSLTVLNGQLYPNTNNYTLNVAGNFICTLGSGTFSDVTVGTVVLNGSGAQSVTDVTFNKLTVSGSGTKSTTGTITVAGITTINSTLAASLMASNIDFNGDVMINASGNFTDGGNTHTFSGTTWTGNGTYSGTGTVVFDKPGGGGQTCAGGSFNNLTLNNGGQSVTFTANVNLTGDLYVSSNINMLYINSGVTVINTSGTGTCTLETAEYIRCRGTNSFPANFASYDIQSGSFVYYEGTSNQNIYGTDYGNIVLINTNTKTLLGDIRVKNTLNFGSTSSTLDISASNYLINIQGNWNNSNNGTFIPRNGEVFFDGTTADQYIQIGTSATNPFYNVSVDKNTFILYNWNNDVTTQNNFKVISGRHHNNSYITYIGGNMQAFSGTFAQSGTYYLNNVGGTPNIQTNGSLLNHLTMNGAGTTFVCADNLSVMGDFNLLAGTFDGSSKTVNLGDAADGVLINGTYKIGAGGIMALGNLVTVAVNGALEVVGSSGSIATVTRNIIGGGGSRYSSFQINSGATINARYYLFEYMSSGGIVINNGATINTTNNFSEGTFNNGVSGGLYLQVENNQRLTMANRIENVSFPYNPGGASVNVKKIAVVSDTLEFYNATGVFAGASFEKDDNNYINWTGPITLTWNGSVSTDWYTALNWTPSYGPNIVPTGNENVIIATATNQPILNLAGALTKNLTINSGANLTITTTTPANDLIINGDITIKGTLTMTGVNDKLQLSGNWQKTVTGTTAITKGTVDFTSNVSRNINNGTSSFGYVIISGSSTFTLGANTTISKDLTLTAGTLDFTSAPYNVTVGGNLNNGANINPRTGKLIMNASTGTVALNPGSSAFYDIDINGGVAAIFTLTTSTLNLTRNLNIVAGTFDLNGLTCNMGDNVGADFLSVSGTLLVNNGAFLKMGTGSSAAINSGGTLKLLGNNMSAIATLTRQGTGTYGFSINSGGTIAAKYYLMEYMNGNGIVVNPGANIDATYNLSNGTFSNGTPGGKFLDVTCTLGGGAGITADSVTFNTGPSINCRRTSGSGALTFLDASGSTGNFSYEQDEEGTKSAISGLVRWAYRNPTLVWTGAVSTQWNVVGNWDLGFVPNSATTAIIPDVSMASNNFPIINTTSDSGTVYDLTLLTGATLTFNNNKGIDVYRNLTNGGTITVNAGSTSLINVKGNFSDNGTITPGNSTVVMLASSGIKNISLGATSKLYNLTINGAATFNLASAITANNHLTLSLGTLDVTSANYAISAGGNITNTATFVPRSGTVTLIGTGAQTINTGIGAGKLFYNLAKSNTSTGTATLASNIEVSNDLTISKGSMNAANNTIYIAGNFTVNNNTSTVTNANVIFNGNATKTFTCSNPTPITFTNVTINKTGVGKDLILASHMNVNGVLTLTMGDVILGARTLTLGNTATISGGGNNSYVQADGSGYLKKLYNALGAPALNLQMGDVNYFAPATFKLNGGTLAGGAYVQFRGIDLTHPNYGSLSPVPSNYITRYWDAASSGITGAINCDITAVYTDADVVGLESAFMPARYLGGWNFGPDFGTWSVNAATNTLIWSGMTSVGSFSGIGYYNISIATGNYSTPANWSFGTVPTNTETAVIGQGTTITLDGASVTNGGTVVNNTGVFNLNGNTLNTGNVNVTTGGTLNASTGSTLNITGTLTNNGTFTAATNSTVGYSSTSTICIAGLTSNVIYYHLNFSGIGRKDLCDSIRVNGNLSITAAPTVLNSQNFRIYLGGNLNNGTGTFNTKLSDWIFTGTTSIATVDTISSIKVLATSTLNIPTGTTVVNANIINNGTISNAAANTIVFNGNTTVSGTSTTTFNNINVIASKTLTAHSSNMGINGNWLNNGTFNHNNGTIIFGGTTDLTGSSAVTFNNIVVNTASSFTDATGPNIAVRGNLTNNGTGAFNHTTGSVTFSNSTTLSGTGTTAFNNVSVTGTLSAGSHNFSVQGNWNSSTGTYNEGTARVTFTGTAATPTITTAATGVKFHLVTINKASGTLTLAGAATRVVVKNELNMTQGNLNQNLGHIILGDTVALAGCDVKYTAGILYNGNVWRYLPAGTISSTASPNYGLFPIGDTLATVPKYRPFALNGTITTGGLIYAKHTNGRDVNNVLVDSAGSTWVVRTREQFTTVDYPAYATPLQLSKGMPGPNNTMAVSLKGSATFGDLPNVGDISDLRAVISNTCRGNFEPTTGTLSNPTLARSGLDRNGVRGVWKPGTTNKLATPLPVTLVNFTARAIEGRKTLVSWKTQTEINSKHFEVQRSFNGTDFETIGIVKAAGNSNAILSYSLIDERPQDGYNYYRLKQVDIDGKFYITSMVKVFFDTELSKEPNLLVYPNPAVGKNFTVLLDNFTQDEVLVVLKDITGKEVFAKAVITRVNNQLTADDVTVDLPAGVYLIVASNNETIVSKRLIIK